MSTTSGPRRPQTASQSEKPPTRPENASTECDACLRPPVLIYVADKRAALSEFVRVLRPGGRISLFEPINRFALRAGDTFGGYDLGPLGDIGKKIRAVYDAIQPRDSDPMLDFDERDLVQLAEEAGFFPIQLLLDAEIRRADPRTWDGFVNSSGNPNVPTVAETIEQALMPAERERFTTYLRPLVEQGLGEWRMAFAHLVGVKPESPLP